MILILNTRDTLSLISLTRAILTKPRKTWPPEDLSLKTQTTNQEPTNHNNHCQRYIYYSYALWERQGCSGCDNNTTFVHFNYPGHQSINQSINQPPSPNSKHLIDQTSATTTHSNRTSNSNTHTTIDKKKAKIKN